GARTKSNYNQLADLDPDRPSVIGANVVRRYFALGELSPTTALLDNPGLDFRSDRGRTAIEATSQRLLAIANVAEVRSRTRQIGLAGSTSMVNDLRRVTTSDERRMYLLVTLGVYAILVALLRRPGISLYLVATVVLGYLASLGLTDLVFHALHRGPEVWGG